jgi:antitoxin component YwqK of YwqJK toxin-antitoxin module
MKKYLLVFIVNSLFLLNFFTASAQDSIYYYDMSYKVARPEAAAIISIARKEDSGWTRMDYFTYSTKINQLGHYKDHEFEIKHGEFMTFYANELMSSKGSFINNKKMGFHEAYYPNGMMSDSCKFINDIQVGYCNAWYTDGSIKTILQMDTLGNGTGIAIGYFPNSAVSFKGKIAKGMRKTGTWTYYHENGNKASLIKFPNFDETTLNQIPELKLDTIEGISYDSLVEYSSAICFNEDGVEQTDCDFKNSLPQFKNGIPGWLNYLTSKLYGLPNQFLKENDKSIIYVSDFTVSTDGKVAEAILTNKVNPSLDKIIENIFLDATKWTPAKHYNRKVPFMHKQAVVLASVAAMDGIQSQKTKKVISTQTGIPSGRGGVGNPRNNNPL